MTRIASALMALGITAASLAVAAPEVLSAGDKAIEELDRLGAAERQRQATIREVACEAFPDDCPPPVEPWPGVERLLPTSTTSTTLVPPITIPKVLGL